MLFVWSKQRVVPVRVTDLSVTEEAFDVAQPDPREGVASACACCTDDLGFTHTRRHALHGHLRTRRRSPARPARRRCSRSASPVCREGARDHDDRSGATAARRRRDPDDAVPADQPLPRRRARAATCATGRARACRTCGAASSRAGAASRLPASTSSPTATAATCSRRTRSATPSCAGASPTRTRSSTRASSPTRSGARVAITLPPGHERTRDDADARRRPALAADRPGARAGAARGARRARARSRSRPARARRRAASSSRSSSRRARRCTRSSCSPAAAASRSCAS